MDVPEIVEAPKADVVQTYLTSSELDKEAAFAEMKAALDVLIKKVEVFRNNGGLTFKPAPDICSPEFCNHGCGNHEQQKPMLCTVYRIHCGEVEYSESEDTPEEEGETSDSSFDEEAWHNKLE